MSLEVDLPSEGLSGSHQGVAAAFAACHVGPTRMVLDMSGTSAYVLSCDLLLNVFLNEEGLIVLVVSVFFISHASINSVMNGEG